MASTREGMNLRLPRPLKRELRKLANTNGRSLTKEIEVRLTSTIPVKAEVR